MAITSRGVIYLERERFQLALDNREDVFTYIFPTNCVVNTDVIDSDGLKANLIDFIKKNNLSFSNLVIVLSSQVYFERDFKADEDLQMKEYIDNVPFEAVSTKKVPSPTGVKLLVANASLYIELADIFSLNNTILDYVIPEIALGAPIQGFTAATARFILSKSDALSQFKFVVETSTATTLQMPPQPEPQPMLKKKNGTLLLTLPVFALLIIILLVLVFQQMNSNKPKPSPTVLPPLPTSSKLAITPTTATASAATNGAALKKNLTAQIAYDSSRQAVADQLRSTLEGVTTATVQMISSTVTAPKPIVIFSKNVDVETRQKIVDALKTATTTDSTIQEATVEGVDISITIGK